MPRPYPDSSYDDDFCLKPSWILWIAAVFLSRALVLPVLLGFAHFAGVNDEALGLLRSGWNVEYLAPSALSFPVFYALIRRSPTAPAGVRWIWSYGRPLLALSAVIDLTISVSHEVRQAGLGDSLPVSLGLGAIDLYCLLYVVGTRRARDTFASFPPPLEPGKR